MAYDSEATRGRIFAAAVTEFSERGLAGARIERIASAAHANKQAIYLYFGGKDQLFAAVVRAKMAEVGKSIDIDPERVVESVEHLFDWYQEHPELIRLLLWQALEERGPSSSADDFREASREKARRVAGVDGSARDAQDLMFTVFGLIAWSFAVPQMRSIMLEEDDEVVALARRRATVLDTVRVLVDAHGLG